MEKIKRRGYNKIDLIEGYISMNKLFLLFVFIFIFSISLHGLDSSDIGILSVKASSTLKDKNDQYNVENIVDGTNLVWCEGKKDDGIGESVVITLSKEIAVKELYISNGLEYENDFKLNNRIKDIDINGQVITLNDIMGMQKVKLKKEIKSDKFTFKVLSVYKGSKYSDTCITEIAFINKPVINVYTKIFSKIRSLLIKGAKFKIIGALHAYAPYIEFEFNKLVSCTGNAASTDNIVLGEATVVGWDFVPYSWELIKVTDQYIDFLIHGDFTTYSYEEDTSMSNDSVIEVHFDVNNNRGSVKLSEKPFDNITECEMMLE